MISLFCKELKIELGKDLYVISKPCNGFQEEIFTEIVEKYKAEEQNNKTLKAMSNALIDEFVTAIYYQNNEIKMNEKPSKILTSKYKNKITDKLYDEFFGGIDVDIKKK